MSNNKDGIDALYEKIFIDVDEWGYTHHERARREELMRILFDRYGGPEEFKKLDILWYSRVQSCTDEEYWEYILLCEKAYATQKGNKTGAFAEKKNGEGEHESK